MSKKNLSAEDFDGPVRRLRSGAYHDLLDVDQVVSLPPGWTEGQTLLIVGGVPTWVTPADLSSLPVATTLDSDDSTVVIEDGVAKLASRDQLTMWSGAPRLLRAGTGPAITTTTPTSVFTGGPAVIPANYLALNDVVRIEHYGRLTQNNATAQTAIFSITWNGNAFGGRSSASMPQNATIRIVYLEWLFLVTALGSGSVGLAMFAEHVGAPGGTGNDTDNSISDAVRIGVDTTVSNSMDVICDLSNTATNFKHEPIGTMVWHARPWA